MVVIFRIRHGTRGDPELRSEFQAPKVIRDGVDDLWSPLDGTAITSKRAYYKQLREQGLEIDDKPRMREKNSPQYDDAGLRQDIVRAIQDPAPDLPPERIAELDD